MGLEQIPSSERIQIGFFGSVNAGKSSVVNAITGQTLSLVSDQEGTTTDPVKKAMELLPLGPVVLIDTPGLEDNTTLGKLRMEKVGEVLSRIHIAVLVVDGQKGLSLSDENLLHQFEKSQIPYILAFNKCDLLSPEEKKSILEKGICISAKTGENIVQLKEAISNLGKEKATQKYLLKDVLAPKSSVLLVIPIDKAAPKGRLILPQQQTLRELLDMGCRISICQDTELVETLQGLKELPDLVITDSQVFEQVKEVVPGDVPLTSFSILFARYKGNLKAAVEGAKMLSALKDQDKVLIAEGCTHHRQCGDIGTCKLPAWIKKFTGKDCDFTFTSGEEFPKDVGEFKLVIHCGACMLNEKQVRNRIRQAGLQGVLVTNYGIVIAYMNGILERSIEPFQGKL